MKRQKKILNILGTLSFSSVIIQDLQISYTISRIMLTEAYLPIDELVTYYGTKFDEISGDLAHLPLNLNYLQAFKSPKDLSADNLHKTIKVNSL